MSGTAALVEATLRDSLEGVDEVALVSRLCDRLVAAGMPLTRMAVACDMLDPSFDSHGVTWKRGEGATIEDYERSPSSEAEDEWLKSPFHALVTSDDRMLRRRLVAGYTAGEFPVLDEFKRRGTTDYVCIVERIANEMCFGVTRGVVASWCAEGEGFDDASIRLLDALMPAFATAFLARTMRKTTRALLATYLGQDAADRVLAGNVIRGRAERLRAVVWFADLVGFTRVADTQTGEVVLAMLNDYAEAQVEAIESHGGHVLKFIGDGLLAIFPGAEEVSACRNALDAADDFRARVRGLNERRRTEGLPTSDAHVALHIGEVLYGNVGSLRRLDFTVLGAAVNEAARIEALCGSLDQPVIVSTAFADAAGDARSRLVSLGRYAMKGVSKPQELFTLEAG
ncbi:MAG TPA: adenylate/guanylate cyclase domain-containing protein [Casimicrobiaceae bacterium]